MLIQFFCPRIIIKSTFNIQMAVTLKQSFLVLFFCVLISDTTNQETTEEEETTEKAYLFRFKNLFPKQAIDF